MSEPNLEAIAALQPDLILSSTLRHEALYDTLSAIAPTVFAERPGVSWKQNFALYAQAVGEEEALPSPRPTISVVRLLEDSVRCDQRANFLGTLFTDLGQDRIVDHADGDLAVLDLAEHVDVDA